MLINSALYVGKRVVYSVCVCVGVCVRAFVLVHVCQQLCRMNECVLRVSYNAGALLTHALSAQNCAPI